MAKPTWLIAGDDVTQGIYTYLRDALADRVVGDVIGSKDSTYKSWVRDRMIDSVVDETKPEVVVVALGTFPSGGEPAGFANDVREIVTQARKQGAQAVLVGPFANDADGKKLATMRSFVPDTISGYALAEGLPRAGALFTQDGYKALSRRFVAAVTATLDARKVRPTQPTQPRPTQPGTGVQPSLPQAPMASRPVASSIPVWIWGLAGVVGLSAVVLTVVLVKRRSSLAEYTEQDSLHERIAKALGWPVKDTQSFSLAALRELLRPVSPKLVDEIDQVIRRGEVVKGGRYRRPRRYDY